MRIAYIFQIILECSQTWNLNLCHCIWKLYRLRCYILSTPLYQSVWYEYVRSAIKVYYVLGLQLFTFELNSLYSCLFCSLTLNMFSLSMHKLPACKFFILLYYSSEWLICLQHLFVSMSELLSNIDSHVRIMFIVSV